MELIKIDPKEFGVQDSIAKEISNQFKPMLDAMESLEVEYNNIVNLSVEDAETSKLAKVLRKRYAEIRIATSEIHKEQKAFYLAGGRFIDGWKNAQIFASKGKEERLLDIENFLINKEKERLSSIQKERENILSAYVDVLPNANLGEMEADVWEAYLSVKVSAYNTKIEQEKEAQKLLDIKKKEEAEERQRLIDEGIAYRKEIAENEKKHRAEIDRLKKESESKLNALTIEKKIDEVIEKKNSLEKEIESYEKVTNNKLELALGMINFILSYEGNDIIYIKEITQKTLNKINKIK